MAKIAFTFFAALAFSTVLAHSGHKQEQRNREVQELLKLVQSIGNEASSSVQNASAEDVIHRRILVSQSNELAHNVHDATYNLQQTIDHNQGGQGQQVLKEVVKNLSNIVHSIQEALNNEPDQLKTQLKSQVDNIVAEAQKLGPVIQQAQHSPHINAEIEVVLDDLLTALYQVQVRNGLVGQTQEQLKSQIQEVTKQVADVIQTVSSEDEGTIHDLAFLAHHLAQHLGHVTHSLEKEIHNHDGEVRNDLEQIVNKLSEIRASLDQAGLNEESNQVPKLKVLLKSNVHNIAVQIKRLVQVAHSNIANEREAQDLRNVIQGVVARSVVASKQLQRAVKTVIQSYQQN